MEEVCFPFLTKAEIKQIERGEDLYIHKHTEINQKTGKPVKGIDERLRKLEEQPKRKSK